jgi:hypothetical protein
VRKGYIKARDADQGPGSRRSLSPFERRVLTLMGEFVKAGIRAEKAHGVAREYAMHGFAKFGNHWITQDKEVA